MPADPTLDLDLAAVLDESRRLAASVTPASGPWDAIVVGSGAAGGMAAYQLAMAGIKVLVLEAGRMIDHRKEYRTMEWPYASPRRHRLPPDQRALAVAEYNFLDRPYGNDPAFAQAQEARLLRGQHVHPQLGGRREAAPDHGHALLVGARAGAGRQDQLLGPRGHPLRAAAVPGGQPRRLRRRLALRLRGAEAVLRQGGRAARRLGDARRASTRCRTASTSAPTS